jgi:GntR family transcriptional regulator/MocR family aminotransferase
LENGARLPASRDLALQLGISRISVVNAYAELRSEGYLSTDTGRGTFVSTPTQFSSRPYAQNGAEPTQDLHAFRDLMRLAYKPNVINFSHGTPPGDFYPVQQLHGVINRVIERDGASALGYEPPEGYAPLRASVRDYVNSWGIRCLPSQVLVTGGRNRA